jgi:hypothetical protein
MTVNNAHVGELAIGGTAVLQVAGDVYENGAMVIGGGTTGQASLVIEKYATWTVSAQLGVLSGSASSYIYVQGTLLRSNTIKNTGDTGIQTPITVTGTIEAAYGSLSLANSVTNDGTLETSGGTLNVSGNVAGTGMAIVNAGTLNFEAGFNQDVSFGSTGVLELAQSQSFTETITNFSTTTSTSLDLADIGYVSKYSEAIFTGTTSSGVLTVSDGSHTAKINLNGNNFLSSKFYAYSDGHGGTIIKDPTKERAVAATANPRQAFVTAMAGMGDSMAASTATARYRVDRTSTLLGPRVGP